MCLGQVFALMQLCRFYSKLEQGLEVSDVFIAKILMGACTGFRNFSFFHAQRVASLLWF